MDVDRRSVVKGMAASGALLWFGAPRWALPGEAGDGGRFALLLAHGEVDTAFARGARTVLSRAGCPELEVLQWNGGPVGAPGALAARMERSRGSRWIAVLDDAGAAIFQELVRGVGGRLLSRGHHVASPLDPVPFRHLWVAASPAYRARSLLEARLAGMGPRFVVAESCLDERSRAPSVAGDDVPEAAGGWVACVGQAVAASALGLRPAHEAPRAPSAAAGEPALEARFASFVVDL